MEDRKECTKCKYRNKCHHIIQYNSKTCINIRKENKNETDIK